MTSQNLAFRALLARAGVILVCALGAPACGEEEAAAPAAEEKKPPVRKPPEAKKAEAAKASAEPLPPPVEFEDNDFTESERSRDPFRSFANLFAEEAKERIRNQREVVLDQYAITELKLIAIVGRVRPARAMLVDPTGLGHVVTRGQFLGRAEVVRGGATNADYEINWRVDRIRDNDVVLVREDPANPDVPSTTKILVLKEDDILAVQ